MIGLVSELAANSDAISEAITKPVHLYSIFIISDFILDDRNKIKSYKAGLINFYEEYYNDDKKSLIVENYYENSQEGTGSKMKRVKRNTLLKEYLNKYIN